MNKPIGLLCLLLSALLLFDTSVMGQSASKITISGYIKEAGSAELLPGVHVMLKGTRIGTQSNNYGFYSLSFQAQDSIEVVYSFVGYQVFSQKVHAKSKSVTINVDLKPSNQDLEEVKVVANSIEQQKLSEQVQMSQISIPIQQIKEIPAFMGEKDVLKVLQLMPGVQKGSEGNAGIYVRGGGPDQNLLILDDAPVYNAYHLFGFFSVFNGDALKSVELTKGGFPARFGGRLSSVIEMQMKEGSKQDYHVEGGIGLIGARVVAEGPIDKQKRSSFLVSARRTYLDILTQPLIPKEQKGSRYYFYDFNAKLNYDFGQKNRLFLSGYFGQDRLYVRDMQLQSKLESSIEWGNQTATMRWNHLYSDNLFSNLSLIYSKYDFMTSSLQSNLDAIGINNFSLYYSSGIRDLGAKFDIDFLPNPIHTLKAGALATMHRFTPSAIELQDDVASRYKDAVENIDALELGVYVEDNYKPLPNLRFNVGLRYSSFSTSEKEYHNWEPRGAMAWTLPKDWALKASYAVMNQYIHLVSNSGASLPTDLWVPSTNLIKPQRSQQVALGFAKDFPERQFSITLEGFYKTMNQIVALKEGSSFILNGSIQRFTQTKTQESPWESNMTAGKGRSYGAEFLLQKKTGKFSGWIGYTLSWIFHQFDELNFGKEFYPKYDRRHDLSLVGIYHLKPNVTLSATWVYGTGNVFTIPISTYEVYSHIPGLNQTGVNQYYNSAREIPDYRERNNFRAPPYHRLDVGVQFHKKMKKGHTRTWEFGVYNLYNRKNAYFYSFKSTYNTTTDQTTKSLAQYALFGIIPSATYSFKF